MSVVVASLGLAIAGSARGQHAQPDAPPAKDGSHEVAPRGQRETRPIKYGEWRKQCFKPAGAKPVCRTSITGTFETGQAAVRVDLIEREGGGNPRLQIFLPVGLYLPPGVKMTVDESHSRRLPFSWCLTNACIAADIASPAMIKQLETGHTLQLEVVDSNILAITTKMSLTGFAAARNGTPAQLFEQAIDEPVSIFGR